MDVWTRYCNSAKDRSGVLHTVVFYSFTGKRQVAERHQSVEGAPTVKSRAKLVGGACRRRSCSVPASRGGGVICFR